MKGSIRFNDAVNAEVTTDGTEITKEKLSFPNKQRH